MLKAKVLLVLELSSLPEVNRVVLGRAGPLIARNPEDVAIYPMDGRSAGGGQLATPRQ